MLKNSHELVKVKTNVTSSGDFKFICFGSVVNGLKIRFLSVYTPSNSSKSLVTVLNMLILIINFIPKKFLFYILGEFKLPNIGWNIPSKTYNDCHKSLIKFYLYNLLTQLIDSTTHKNGNILDLLLCNKWLWIELRFILFICL